jgi:hypothetical protein
LHFLLKIVTVDKHKEHWRAPELLKRRSVPEIKYETRKIMRNKKGMKQN